MEPRPEITPVELARELEGGAGFHVLDVRAEHRLADGRIEIVAAGSFHNVPGSRVLAAPDPAALGLDRAAPLAVVCGRGRDSVAVARFLRERGFDARSLAGGMLAWSAAVVPRELAPPEGIDRLIQLDRIGKGALGYLLASDGEALVVDPSRHADVVESLLAAGGLRLAGVAETHVHADYLSGASRLAERHGVPHLLHPADAVSPYDGTPGRLRCAPLAEGRALRVGRAEIGVVHTPGHTEGSVTLAVADEVALTGDFLFVESVGRPDLGGRLELWTDLLFSSLERARRTWPAASRILPAHYASERERNPDRSVGSPLAALPARNEALGIPDRATFRAWVAARAGSFPEAYRQIKLANLGLVALGDDDADSLEAGRNLCALG